MDFDYKSLLYITVWLTLLYFIGVRRISLFCQGVRQGRLINTSVNKYSSGDVWSFLSGFFTSLLLQSPFGSFVHIKSYAQSGLIKLKEYIYFIAGAHLSTVLTPLILLTVPTLPDNILITSLLFSCFVKIFFPRFKFWFIDLLIIISIIILSVNSINLFASPIIQYEFKSSHLLFIGLMSGFIFKSQIFCVLLACLAFRFFGINNSFLLYVVGYQLSFGIWHLLKSIESNKVNLFGTGINLFSLIIAIFPALYLAKQSYYEVFVNGMLDLTIKCKESLSHFLYTNRLVEAPVYWPESVNNIAVQIVTFNAALVIFTAFTLLLVNFLFSKRLLTIVEENQSKNKKVQTLSFIDNTQFYSPYLFLDHFKKEVKKMAALLQTVITASLDKNLDAEQLERANKYHHILQKVKVETRSYSTVALKHINIPRPNQEFLFYLQISEVIEKLSSLSIDLMIEKQKTSWSEQESSYAANVLKNYDHLFEVFTLDNQNIYCQRSVQPALESKSVQHITQLEDGVFDLITIIKNLNKVT